ncbi:uncharacterized protein LOC120486109 [Pimephales promelas]|uniref:uncharacterized protein LOC120486109 n=1 Tax=Pimephales promelas TaxID=90988 RepID=UPI0019556B65|nr:uncharacterized protein LOC120486109 [Pimephales promelas]
MEVEGVGGGITTFHKSIQVPLQIHEDEVVWTSFWVGPNSQGSLIGMDILPLLNMIIFTDSRQIATTAGIIPHEDRTCNLSSVGAAKPIIRDWTKDGVWGLLCSLHPEVWAKHKFDCGKANIDPVVIEGPTHAPHKQYPIRPEARRAVEEIVADLEAEGIIRQTSSTTNSPVWPVKKSDNSWRLTIDYTRLNSVTPKPHPIVANPATILNDIPGNARIFTVLDVLSAFWSIPIDEKSQEKLAFTVGAKQYVWNRLPQGLNISPVVFHRTLDQFLTEQKAEIESSGSVCLQYVDDLLIASPDENSHIFALNIVLQALKKGGFKVNPDKAQLAKTKVIYLGQEISVEGRRLTTERVEALRQLPKPLTVTGMRKVMGLFNYCRQYIPDFASITSPLIDLYKGGKPGMEQINWTPEAEEAFTSMKEKLTSAPALGLPDGRLPFHLWTRVGDETYSAVLCQKPGDRYKPVGYFSTKIPVTMIGQPRCIQALDGATWAVDAVENLIGAQTIILHTPHSIVTLLNNTNIKTITDARRAKWEATLLNKDLRVEIIRDTSLNPATMMIEPHEGTPHECEKQVEEESLGPVNPTPLENPDKELWVDGSSYYVDGKRHTGWAVVEADGNVVKKGALSGHFSAQVAELIALAEAFELSEGQRVNIYTDSRYAFGVVHDYLALWKKRGLITSNGSEIQHASIIRRLIAACHLPREAAVIKVKSHQSDKSKESQGNTAADAAAREAALLPLTPVTLVKENTEDNPELRLLSYQTETDEEKEQWIKAGAKEDDQAIWRIPTGQVVMPIGTRRELMQLYHGKVHAGAKAMKAQISETWWWPRMMRDIDDYCRRCLIRAMVLPPDAPPPAGTGGDSTLFQEKLRRYLTMLDKAIKDNNKKVREAQQQWDEKHTTTDIPHIPELGSFVMVKRIPRKGLEPRWEGPYEVLLTTDTSVCLKGKGVGTDRWYHWSQVKPCLVNEQDDNDGLWPEIEQCSSIIFKDWEQRSDANYSFASISGINSIDID